MNWLTLAVKEEAHDVRIWRELKRFEKHCGQEGTSSTPLNRDELAQILTDIGYDPGPGQLDALLGATLAQQGQGALSLHWLLQEIEALLGRTDAPTIRQRIMRQQKHEGNKAAKSRNNRGASPSLSPSPAPRAAGWAALPAAQPMEGAAAVDDEGEEGGDEQEEEGEEVSGVAAAAATMAMLLSSPVTELDGGGGVAAGAGGGPAAAGGGGGVLEVVLEPRQTRSSVRRRKASVG